MTNNPNIIRQLETLIRDICQQEISKAKFNKMIAATVTAVDGDTVDVELNDDGVSLTDVLNRTGETLLANDEIYILRINNSSSNFCAAIKK